jgi:hypothetical protein
MTAHRPRKATAALHPDAIDALYGLEPVFEPGQDAASDPPSGQGTQFAPIQCPYCGESFETMVDLSAGSASYIEDCQICCQPIELSLEVDDAGALSGLTAKRTD